MPLDSYNHPAPAMCHRRCLALLMLLLGAHHVATAQHILWETELGIPLYSSIARYGTGYLVAGTMPSEIDASRTHYITDLVDSSGGLRNTSINYSYDTLTSPIAVSRGDGAGVLGIVRGGPGEPFLLYRRWIVAGGVSYLQLTSSTRTFPLGAAPGPGEVVIYVGSTQFPTDRPDAYAARTVATYAEIYSSWTYAYRRLLLPAVLPDTTLICVGEGDDSTALLSLSRFGWGMVLLVDTNGAPATPECLALDDRGVIAISIDRNVRTFATNLSPLDSVDVPFEPAHMLATPNGFLLCRDSTMVLLDRSGRLGRTFNLPVRAVGVVLHGYIAGILSAAESDRPQRLLRIDLEEVLGLDDEDALPREMELR